ncbi:CheR family methyltransferase [Pseudomonadota bacterium]
MACEGNEISIDVKINDSTAEKREFALFLEAIYSKYGYDFRNYTEASMYRRIRLIMDDKGIDSVAALTRNVLQDEAMFDEVIQSFSIVVTELFRDPRFYKALRHYVVPLLKQYPNINIWHAGCATGEEVYSLAVLLKEEGIYDRATILATDLNNRVLDVAREGVYPLAIVEEHIGNFVAGGGKGLLTQYYQAQGDKAVFSSALKENMTFSWHNMATDKMDAGMHLILCRNVIIYFNKALKNRVLRLFKTSLIKGGILCLGANESLYPSVVFDDFMALSNKQRVYQKLD